LTVTITSPQDGSTVSEIVTITCNASDNSRVAKVELWVDDSSTEVIDDIEPYVLKWNTTVYQDSTSHTVKVKVYDVNGNNSDSKPITLIVDNSNSYPSQVNITSIKYTQTELTVIWEQSADPDFDYYELLHSDSETGIKSSIVKEFDQTQTNYSITSFDPTHENWFWVTVTDTLGYSKMSDGMMIIDNPPAPSELYKIKYQDDAFYISWSKNNEDDFLSYSLNESYSEDMSNENEIFTTSGREDTTYIVNGIGINEFRYYRLVVTDFWNQKTSSTVRKGSSKLTHDIVFASDRDGDYMDDMDIYMMDSEGNNIKNLTNAPSGYGGTPVQFSPDGLNILYLSRNDLYTMDRDGNNQTQLTFGLEPSTPQFSPDGSKIVFQSHTDGSLYIMENNGSNQTKLLVSGGDYHPQFSPDGTRIAFTSGIDGNEDIYIMDSDGGNQLNLTNNDEYNTTPKFSPDGSKIVFVSSQDMSYLDQIYVMNIDGSEQIRLTELPAYMQFPQFSPDGLKILFMYGYPNSDIWIMNSDGSGQNNLTNSNSIEAEGETTYPQFSPDGLKILFTDYVDNQGVGSNYDIAIMNSDGTNRKNLTNSPSNDRFPIFDIGY